MIKINKNFDVPYLAGYSIDGKTIYIDRDMPNVIKIGHMKIGIVDFLLETHEHIEKALETCGLTYSGSHKLATTYEHYVAMKHGIEPQAYEAALKPYEHKAMAKPNPKLPPDLDPQPYLDDKNHKKWFE